MLGWWTAGDLATFLAHFFGAHAYTVTYFAVNLPLMGLEVCLMANLCGVLVKEHQGLIQRYSAILGLVVALGLAWRHHTPLYIGSVLLTELACCGVMAILLALGWIGMVELLNREVSHPWRAIIAGSIFLVAVQALSFGLQAHYQLKYWDVISRIRPIGELLALSLWILAALQKVPQTAMARDFIPNRESARIQPTSVGTAEIFKMFG